MTQSLEQQINEEQSDVRKDVEKLRLQYEKECRINAGTKDQTLSNLAWYLTKSIDEEDRKEGVEILKGLVQKDHTNREYLYFLAVGCYSIQDYGESRKYVEALLAIEPKNRQALELQKLVQDKLTQDGLLGMAITGGAVALVGLASILLAKGLSKR